jgi:CHAP domain
MASVSGLSAEHRRKARQLAVQAAMLGYNNKGAVHYTQGSRRWTGINKNLRAAKGQFPRYADCSAYATWCVWNGLIPYGVRDTVNALRWQGGFTGTMLKHGKRVQKIENVLPGDCVIYGKSGTNGKHTAIVVGRRNGVPMVVSHGSEGGPYYVKWNYRKDVMQIRRYI